MKLSRQLFAMFVVLMLASFGGAGCNRGNNVKAAEDRASTVLPAEQDFMMKATQANLAEIDVSRLALQKSDNSDVRDFANMIQSDHIHSLEDLTDLMDDKNVGQPKTLATDAQQDIARMNQLTGPEFDREFVNMMVMDHRKAVDMFRDQLETAQNADIRKYIDDTLPKLEMHLDKAQKLQSKLFSGARR